jgi:predicted GTPase
MQEARAVVTGHAFSALGEAAKTRVAAMLVREIADVAIGLYSGAYRTPLPGEAIPHDAAADEPGPITVLVTGQANAGKSSLVNAMLGRAWRSTSPTGSSPDFARLVLENEQVGELALIDSPGLGPEPTKEWREQARRADLILWVVAANRADRAPDQRAIRELRNFARDDIRLRQVPIVLVATHADRLAPPMEWSPPYDLARGTQPKELNMRAALAAAGNAMDIPEARRVLVSVEAPGEKAWNMPALFVAIHDALDDAHQKRLERGRGREGWLKSMVDLARSVPGTVGKMSEFIRR